jgi:hypothetical protein
MTPRLHISVPASWRVELHELLDEDPELDNGVCVNLSEDLLQLRRGAIVVDAGFYGDKYRVVMVEHNDWEHPLRQQDCQHRSEVVSIVENWIRDDTVA